MAATSNTSTTTPALPGSACGSNNSCGATTLLPTSAAQCYNPSPYVRDCILSSRVIHGIFSFRGWSTKVDGSWSTYSVQVGNVERWSDGWRYKAGPFEASGYTDTENENSQTDTWPKRSDCWGGRPYDGPHCPAQVGSGFWAMYGRNTWVWAKHDTCYYYYPSGPYSCSVYENLDADNYDGGTEAGTYAGPVSYYIRPSTIRAGQTGSWAKYAPESKLTFYQGSSVTYGSSASISVNWSEAYSSATFSSSMSVQTLRKTTQFEEFRSKSLGLPWFDTGGWFYRYDGGHSPWKYEYWSCEWSPGWTGGSPCWTNGS